MRACVQTARAEARPHAAGVIGDQSPGWSGQELDVDPGGAEPGGAVLGSDDGPAAAAGGERGVRGGDLPAEVILGELVELGRVGGASARPRRTASRLDRMNAPDPGHVPSTAEILDAVRELHDAGQNEISPLQALEHISPGYTEASKAADVDLVFPTVVHIFEQAGRDGVLTIEGVGSDVLAVFPTEATA